MAQIAETNSKYRTKDQIVRDVAVVLNSPLTYGTKCAVLLDVGWVWTEFHGKYEGCPYWSERALEQFEANAKTKLRHEHAVPKSVIIAMLVEIDSPTHDQVRDICERLLIGVVVTREEDNLLNREFKKTMPPEFFDPQSADYHNPWLRYKRCGIPVACRRNDVVPTCQTLLLKAA